MNCWRRAEAVAGRPLREGTCGRAASGSPDRRRLVGRGPLDQRPWRHRRRRGGAQGVRSHMGNSRGLPRGSGGGRCCGSPHVTSSAATDEPPAELVGDGKLATSEGSCPGDGVPGAPIARCLRLEQRQHAFCAGRCPRRDDPSVAFAQRLRRAHVAHLRNCVAPRSNPRPESVLLSGIQGEGQGSLLSVGRVRRWPGAR
jgi:hypothetical protein